MNRPIGLAALAVAFLVAGCGAKETTDVTTPTPAPTPAVTPPAVPAEATKTAVPAPAKAGPVTVKLNVEGMT